LIEAQQLDFAIIRMREKFVADYKIGIVEKHVALNFCFGSASGCLSSNSMDM